MSKKQEKAIQSIKGYFHCDSEKYGCNEKLCQYRGGNSFASDCDPECDADAYYAGFNSGWESALDSLLINVKERQPDPNEEVICRMVSNGAFVSGYIFQEDGKYKVATSPDFHFEDYGNYECDYWFPKPKLNNTNN